MKTCAPEGLILMDVVCQIHACQGIPIADLTAQLIVVREWCNALVVQIGMDAQCLILVFLLMQLQIVQLPAQWYVGITR